MTYDWTLLQTLVFIITPYFLMLALASKDEDDGPPDGGMMTPAYQGAGVLTVPFFLNKIFYGVSMYPYKQEILSSLKAFCYAWFIIIAPCVVVSSMIPTPPVESK